MNDAPQRSLSRHLLVVVIAAVAAALAAHLAQVWGTGEANVIITGAVAGGVAGGVSIGSSRARRRTPPPG